MMSLKWIRKKIKQIARRRQSRRLLLLACIAIICFGAIGYASYMQDKRLLVDESTYKPLLQLIASVESKGNYNAYFGNAKNSKINFTDMSIAEVMRWQSEYIEQGNYSSAVGRYQIISTTLNGLVSRLGIDTSQKFNEPMQDTLAIALLERRGAIDFVNQELTREQFAANLAKEWAALPKVIGDNPSDSYYAGDGVNKALVDVHEVIAAIDHIEAK